MARAGRTLHVSQSLMAGLSSSIKTRAMFANTCSGTTTISVLLVLSSKNGWGTGEARGYG